MTRTFISYFPLWMPAPTRSNILWRDTSEAMALAWFRVLAGVKYADKLTGFMRGTVDEIRQRAILVYAYARDTERAFAQDNAKWQLAWAEQVAAAVTRKIKQPSILHMDNKSLYQQIGIELDVTCLHPRSSMLKFQWVEMLCTVDVDALWDYLSKKQEPLERVYKRRWADPRYGFATPSSCPIPTSAADLREMEPFKLGLAIDVVLHHFLSSWDMCRVRDFSYWGIKQAFFVDHTQSMSSIFLALQLKPELKLNALDGPYTNKLQALCAELPGDISYRILPATLIAKLDQLVEEMSHATQHQGQQGQIRESEGSIHEPEASTSAD